MTWKIEFETRVEKSLKKIDRKQLIQIREYLETRVANNPRQFGKSLKSRFVGLWRYRVGNYRIVCQLQDDKLVVLVVKIGHRKEIYK